VRYVILILHRRNTCQTLTAAVEAVQTKEAELLQLITDSVSPVLEAIDQMGTVGVIYVYGYTPNFNDGEPCKHETDSLIGMSDINGKARLYGELSDDLGLTPEGDYDYKAISAAISNVVIPALDREFTANYQVVYTFNDGTFTRHVDDYDCGY